MKSLTYRLAPWLVVTVVLLLLGGLSLVEPTRHPPEGPAPVRPGLARTALPEMEAGRTALRARYLKLAAQGPKRFDQPDQAAEFYLRQRLGLGQEQLPLEHLRDVLTEVRARQAARRRSGSLPGGVLGWNSIGPGNVGGRTRAITIDPLNPDIMYAAGVAGGIWKSTDAGASWNCLDDMMLNLAVCAMVIDPTDSNVLYAATGEGFGTGSPFVRGLGIFKSLDAGATWTQLPGTVNGVPEGAFHYVNKLAISPNDPQRLYAATRFGVWRSLDAGQTWSVVLSNPRYLSTPPATNGCSLGCTDLAVRQDSDPDVIFAAFGSFESDGLYRSDDGGDSWLAYTTAYNQGRMTIAIAPSNNEVIYLLMADNGLGGATGQLVDVYRSTDGGASFSPRVNFQSLFGPWLMSYVSIATGCYDHPVIYSQGWYDNIIVVDPTDPDTVWVGGINLYRSEDGGQNYGITGYWFFYMQDPVPPIYIHPDQHNVVFHPDYNGTTNQIVYVTNDGGIFRTTNAAAATSQEECPFCLPEDPDCPIDPLPEIQWESMNHGYAVTQYYHGDSARQVDTFVGGAQDNGSSRVRAADTPNAWQLIYGGDGGYVAIDPTDSRIMYVEIQGFPTIKKSTDGGDTFQDAVNGITDYDGLFITPFAMDQSDPNILWTGGRRPWRTLNGAASWEPGGAVFSGTKKISAIGIAPSDGHVVYVGFHTGRVARTTNALDPSPTWTTFNAANGLINGAWVSSMAVDPQDPDIAYCTYSNYGIPHLFRTLDGGTTWTSIDGIAAADLPDIPAHWIAVRPCDSQQLYVGTELGVFASDDGGATWEPANDGLANTVVEALDFKNADTLVAFTHGRGAFLTDLEPCPGAGCPFTCADLNGDAVSDLNDFATFANCFGLPADISQDCTCADLDGTGTIDLNDFATFANIFGLSSTDFPPNCS